MYIIIIMENTRKRKAITLETKINIISDVKKGKHSKTEIAKAYDIPASTLSTILKNADKITAAHTDGEFSNKRQKLRTTKYEEIEEVLFKWFQGKYNLI